MERMEINDRELAERLVGTWTTYPADNADVVSTATYSPDGTGTEVVQMRSRPGSEDIRIDIQWSIKDSVLSMKSVASSAPQFVPVGMKLNDRILSLTEDKFISQAGMEYGIGEGEQIVKVRVG